MCCFYWREMKTVAWSIFRWWRAAAHSDVKMWSNDTKCVKIVRIAVLCCLTRAVFCFIALMLLCLLNVSADECVPDPSLNSRFPLATILHVWFASTGWLTACVLFLSLAVKFFLLCSFNSQFVLFAVISRCCLRALLSLAYSIGSVLALWIHGAGCPLVTEISWNVIMGTIFLRTKNQPLCIWWLFYFFVCVCVFLYTKL